MSDRSKQLDQTIREAFNLFRFSGSVFFRSSLAAPWGIDMDATKEIRFHIVLKGDIIIGTADGNRREVNTNEIAIVASDQLHWIADDINSKRIDRKPVVDACNLNSPLFQHGPITHQLICCQITLEAGLDHPLLSRLPDIMILKDLEQNKEVSTIISLLESQLEQNKALKNPISDRLVEILFIHLINHGLSSAEGQNLIQSLSTDRRIFQVLNILHRKPQKNWTVAELGEKIGMSKSTLNRQFIASTGQTPIAYLTNLRLSKAKTLLENSDISFTEIAMICGYSCSRSLNRAFTKQYGHNLKELRDNQTHSED